MRPDWGGWGRTSNLPVNSRALCQLSYTPRLESRASDFTRALRTGQGHRAHSLRSEEFPAHETASYMPLRIHALILAAGQSRRFGGGKLHALHRGRPLLSHVLDVVAGGRKRGLLDGGHVVVAAGDERGLALVRTAGLGTVTNDAPELGLSHSIRLGLAALAVPTVEEAGAVLVFLGDQPLVRLKVVEALVAAWKQGSGPIVRPRYEARPDAPGHPVLLTRPIWARAGQLEGDRGFRALLDSGTQETVTLDVKGDNPDVDTRADLNALEEFSR